MDGLRVITPWKSSSATSAITEAFSAQKVPIGHACESLLPSMCNPVELTPLARGHSNHDSQNRVGYRRLPQAVLDQFVDEHSETTPDGVRWPEPTQIVRDHTAG